MRINEKNNTTVDLLTKFLTLETRGFGLCTVLPSTRRELVEFYSNSDLFNSIHFIDMAKTPLDTNEIPKILTTDYNSWNSKKKIYFIYNIETCVDLLDTTQRKYFEDLNITRDYYFNFNALFIFFMTQYTVKNLVRYAFDFYDWMKLNFTFIPEDKGIIAGKEKMEGIREDLYSNPYDKIEYLEGYVDSVTNEIEKSVVLNDMAALYRQVLDYDAALECLLEVLRVEEKNNNLSLSTYSDLSRAYYYSGQPEKAHESAIQAIHFLKKLPVKEYQLFTKSYADLSGLISTLINTGEEENAFEILRELTIDYDNEQLVIILSNFYYQSEKYRDCSRAIDIIENFLENNDASGPALLFNLANAYDEIGDYEKAIAAYSNNINNYPRHMKSYINRGIVYLNLESYDRALKDFLFVENNYDTMPEPLVFINLGCFYADKKDFGKAQEYFLQYYTINPFNIENLLYLSQMFIVQNHPHQAMEFVAMVLKIDKNNEQALVFKKIIEDSNQAAFEQPS
ncbi:MAG: tetratricopeptide repeat protein [bacterium]|nr:tetratricopeptide repeat protein [bacterium]